MINIPFILSLSYKRKSASVLIAFIIMIYYYLNGYSFDVVLIEYIIYIFIFIILNIKKKSNNSTILVFLFIKGISLTIENYYVLGNSGLNSLFRIFVSLLVFYLVIVTIMYIINLMERAMSLSSTLNELQKEKALKESLFKITHEIKNPIAVCKGYLSMMDYFDVEKIKKYNIIIESEINRALDIMDNFSEYTKIKIDTDIMDVDCLINDTILNMEMFLKNYNTSVKYISGDEILIDGDYNRLKQVLVNVIKNSCEAALDEGVININVKSSNKSVYISLKDNGPGMTPDQLEKIDQLFYSSKEKGCGIGVTLSKEIVRLHKGELKYKSVLEKYTEVIIRLPLAKVSND